MLTFNFPAAKRGSSLGCYHYQPLSSVRLVPASQHKSKILLVFHSKNREPVEIQYNLFRVLSLNANWKAPMKFDHSVHAYIRVVSPYVVSAWVGQPPGQK